ncbi:MAG: hypothetical protein KDA25_03290, partial [Phycisphaerales bacterium]|nr:hypothetical protein [Phycisphaerales bacterium]
MNPRSAALVTGLVLLLPLTAGCQVASLVGGMAQNAEYQKKIEVLAEYTGLENRSTAVLIQAD